MPQKHSWEFRKFFRARAFGWKGSSLAIQRIKEAVREIRKTKDPILKAEGAILLMERLWPALQQVDSSSGAFVGGVATAGTDTHDQNVGVYPTVSPIM